MRRWESHARTTIRCARRCRALSCWTCGQWCVYSQPLGRSEVVRPSWLPSLRTRLRPLYIFPNCPNGRKRTREQRGRDRRTPKRWARCAILAHHHRLPVHLPSLRPPTQPSAPPLPRIHALAPPSPLWTFEPVARLSAYAFAFPRWSAPGNWEVTHTCTQVELTQASILHCWSSLRPACVLSSFTCFLPHKNRTQFPHSFHSHSTHTSQLVDTPLPLALDSTCPQRSSLSLPFSSSPTFTSC